MTRSAAAQPLAGWILASLVLVFPFEPRRPCFTLAGLQVTWLELAAGAAMLALAWSLRSALPGLVRAPPPALAAVSAFALAHVVAAALAPAHRDASLVFSLRMLCAAAFALLVAASGESAVRRALGGLALAGCVVATLAVLEGAGFRTLDSFLGRFRMAPFFVGDARRASATTENPNLAAALIAQGVVAGAGLLAAAGRPALVVGAAALLGSGLLFTYSRGGLAAAALGLAVLAFASGPARRRAPVAALCVLAAIVLGFATRPGFRRHLAVEQRRDAVAARYEPDEAQLSLAPSEARRLSLRVTNTGARRWAPEDGLRLSCAWYAAGWLSNAGCATPLETALGPGESVVLSSEVRAPAASGRYYLVWEMFSEFGRFSTQGVPPALVPARVGDAASGDLEPLPNLVSLRTRSELWRIAVAMWRERPLLGFGPDNFRKLHRQFAGWPLEDERHAAHNSVLEVAATTGLLGLAAFAATLWTVLAALRRTLARPAAVERGTAAVVLGLLAAQLAQSCVDYLLSFTAHYLLFGLVVGASVACERAATSPSAAP